jgi:hypothetical protein
MRKISEGPPLARSAADGPPSLPKKSGRITELPWLPRPRTVHRPCRKSQGESPSSPDSLGHGRSTVPAKKVRENPRAPLAGSAADGPQSLPKRNIFWGQSKYKPQEGETWLWNIFLPGCFSPQSYACLRVWGKCQSKYKPQQGETWFWNIFQRLFLPGCFFPQSYACLRVWGKCQSKYKPQQGATIPKNVPMEPILKDVFMELKIKDVFMEPKIKDVLMEPNIKDVFRSQM